MKLAIEKVVYGGQGLARIPEGSGPQSGMRIFVPFTLAGEMVEAEIARTYRGYCEGNAVSIEQAAAFRTVPPCPVFGICGGCQLQHANYTHQVAMKVAMLTESLTRGGIRNLPEVATLVGQPVAYRNRIRLQVQAQPQFSIGYRQARSHRVIAIDRCPIAMPVLQQAIAAMRTLADAGCVPGNLAEIELFTNHDESELLLSCWTTQGSVDKQLWTGFLSAVQKDLPALTGAAIFPADKTDSHATRPVLQWGNRSLQYAIADRSYRVSLGSFFQTNSTLLDNFVVTVIGNDSGNSAWDLYAGSGLFSLPLTEHFSQVTAVEANPAAMQDLRANLHSKAAHLVERTTLDFLKASVPQVERGKQSRPELILLDPPRAGAGAAVCQLLARCNPRRIVYVSCDPATLGRDLAALIQSGYQLQHLHMVDMFPQTTHLETIAMLER